MGFVPEIKYLVSCIGNIYRRPTSILDELDQFIEEFTLVAHNLQEKRNKSIILTNSPLKNMT